MIAIFARANDAREFVQFKCDLGLECQAGAFDDQFWSEFISHAGQYNKIIIDGKWIF